MRAAVAVQAAVAALFAPAARAATLYWDTNGTTAGSGAATGTWGSSAFWNTDAAGGSGTLGAATTAADDVVFSAGTNGTTGTVTVSGAVAANSLSFQNDVALTISGGTSITLGGGTGTAGVFVLAGVNQANTVGTPLLLAASAAGVTFGNAGTGLLTFSNTSTITGSATTGNTQVLTFSPTTAAGGITVAGVIGNGAGGGNVAAVVGGGAGGATTFSATNTFTGGITINSGGRLVVTSDANLGATPGAAGTNITIDGGTLQQNAGFNIGANRQIAIGAGGATFNVNQPSANFNVQGVIKDAAAGAGALFITGTGAGIYVPVAQNTYTGGTHLGATTTTVINSSSIGSASTSDLVSGPFGTGILYMDGGKQRASTGAGPWVIGNAVQITADSAFIAGSNNSLTFTGPVTLTGNRAITQNSPGDIVFAGVVGDGGNAYGMSLAAASTNALVLAAANTYTGPTTINGGTLALAATGSLPGSAITAQTGGTLLFRGARTYGGAFSPSITVVGNTTAATSGGLSLVDGAIGALTFDSATPGTPVLAITGAAGSPGNLNLEVGATADQLVFSNGTQANIGAGGIRINLTSLGGLTGTPQTLISSPTTDLTAGGPITLGNVVGNFNGYTLSLNVTANAVTLVETANTNAAPAVAYFKGNLSGKWNDTDAGGLNNFTTDLAGTTPANQLPGTGTVVRFNATGATNLATTLNQSFAIDSLVYEATATAASSIAPGTPAGTLTLAPASSANGISLAAGAGAVTISAPVVVGADLSITNNSSNTLTLSGGISGTNRAVTINGTGAVTIQDPAATNAGASVNLANSSFGGGTLTLAGGTLNLRANGDGTTAAQTLNYTTPLAVTGAATINADYVAAAGGTNKTLAFPSTALGPVALGVVGASHGYTLALGNVTLTAAGGGTSTVGSTTSSIWVTAGNVTGSATAGNTDTLVLGGIIANAGSTVSGAISDGAAGGKVGVTTNTVAFWSLSGSTSNTYTGPTLVSKSGSVNGAGLTLAKTGGAIAVPGDLTIGDGTATPAFVSLAGSNQIATTSTVTFNGVQNGWAYLKLQGNSQTIGNVAETNAGFGVIETREGAGTFGTSTVTFNVATGTQAYQGYFRDIQTGLDATNSLALVKAGAGTLQFGAANNGAGSAGTAATTHQYSGGTTILNGTLQLMPSGSSSAISLVGAGNVTIDGGATVAGTLDLNGTSAGITGLNGAAGAVPGRVVNNGAGTATLSVGNNGNNGSFAGVLANNSNAGAGVLAVTKVGAGTQVLSGPNTYTGATTVSAGTLQFANPAALYGGNPANWTPANVSVASGGVLGVNVGGSGEFTTANVATLVANLSTVNNNGLRAGSLVGFDTTNAAGTVTYATPIGDSTGTGGGAVGVAKNGAGALTLSGASTYSGSTLVNAGTLNLTGSSTGGGSVQVAGGATMNVTGTLVGNGTSNVLTFGGATAGNAVVNVTGSGTVSNFFSFAGANLAGSNAVYNQTGGNVNFTFAAATNNVNYVALAGYGYMNVTGGTLTAKGRFAPSNGSTATGVIYVGGTGTIDHTGGEWLLMSYTASGNGGQSMITVGPGGSLLHAGASNNFGLNMDRTNGYAVLNVAGGLVTTSTTNITFGNGTAASITGTVGMMNLAAGTLTAGKPFVNGNSGTGSTGNNAYVNFAGGTIQANAAIAGLVPASGTNQTVTATVFGPINNAAATGDASQNFTGNAVFDTNGFAVTTIAPLVAPTGVGVSAANLSFSNGGGAGYIGAPFVKFSAPAGGGVPAAGYALVAGGKVTGIVITSPGTYTTAEPAPTVTLTGGGASTPTVVTVSPLTVANNANVSGGVVKNGEGVLTLQGVNTFSGASTINAGTLALGNTAAQTLAGNFSGAGILQQSGTGTTTLTGSISLGQLQGTAGTIVITGATNLNATPVLVNGGTFDLGGRTMQASQFTLTSGAIVNGTLAGAAAGQTFLKQGPGTLTISSPVSNFNAVTVNQGLANQTSNPAGASTLTLNFAGTGMPTTDVFPASSPLVLGGPAASVTGGGVLALAGSNANGAANSQTFASTLVDHGASGVSATVGTGTTPTLLLNLGTLSRNPGGTLDVTLPAGTQSATNGVVATNPGTGGTLVASTAGTAYATVGGDNLAAWSTASPGNIVSAAVAGAGGTSIYTAATTAGTFTGNADVTAAFTAGNPATVNSIRMNTGALTLTLGGATTVNSGAVLFGSGITSATVTGGSLRPGAGQELVFLSNKPNVAVAITSSLTDGASGPTTVTYRGNPNGATIGGLFNIGAASVANTYTGPTYITNGRVNVAAVGTTPFGTGASAIVYVDGTQDGQFYTAQNMTIANPFVVVGQGLNEGGTRRGVIRLDSSTTATPTLSGAITLVGDASIGNNAANTTTGTALISGNIGTSNAQGATSFALTKVMPGMIRLTGTNSQTATNINAGGLNINANAALGVATAPLTFTGSGTLAFAAVPAFSLPASRSIAVAAGTATFDTSTVSDANNTVINGVISGPGALTKSYGTQGTAAKPLVLTGANTFTGNVTVTGGWLTITNSQSLGLGTKTVSMTTNASSDSLHLDPSLGSTPGVPIDLPATISFNVSNDGLNGNNLLAANEGVVTNESGNNIIRGNFTLNSGGGGTALSSKAGTITFTGNFTPNQLSRALFLRGDGAGVITGVIADGTTVQMPVTKSSGTGNNGTWTLGGANTYSGQTAVQAGTIRLGSTAGLGAAGGQGFASAAGATAPNTVVSAGGTLDLAGTTGVTEQITLNGTGVGGNGALVNSNAAAVATLTAPAGTLSSVTVNSGTTGIASASATVNNTGTGGTGAAVTANLGVTAASFTVAGGTTVYSVAPTVTISGGGGSGATATATLTGGVVSGITITAAGTGYTSAPTIAFTAGTITTAGTNPTGTGNGTNFTINSVTLTNAGTGYTTAPTFTLGAATITPVMAGVVLATASSVGGPGDILLGGTLSGPGALTKVGAGTLTLAGTATHAGGTTVSGGRLLVNGAATGQATFSVGSGGTLGGGVGAAAGSVNLNASAQVLVQSGGVLAPGGAAGTTGILNVLDAGTPNASGTLQLAAGGAMSLDLAGAAPGTGYDQVNVTGTVNVAGAALSVNLAYAAAQTDRFFVLTNDGTDPVAGQFATLNGQPLTDNGDGTYTAMVGLQPFTLTYTGDAATNSATPGTGNDVVIAVPEPGSAALAGLAVAGLLARRRRRR
ncbi:MAG TPA: autotransporter-associated beta strand repeat-containing protein [Humisphaera sp.]